MKPSRALLALSLALPLSIASRAARADTVAREDLFGHEVRVERGADGALSLLVAGEPARSLAPGGTTHVQRVPVGAGAALVITVDGPTPALALVAGSASVPASALFAGPREHTGEDASEAYTTDVRVGDFDGNGAPDVVLGERHDDARLCVLGRPLVNARVVHPTTLRLAAVVLNPLRAELAERPVPAPREIFAVAHAGPAPVLPALVAVSRIARGSSQTPPAALTDRAEGTAWSLGDREAVTLRASLAGFDAERVVLTSPAAPAQLPRAFTLFMEPGDVRLDVTVPPALAAGHGTRVAVPIIPPRNFQCISIVVAPPAAGQDRAVAEIALATAADRATDLAAQLVARLEGEHGDEAAQLLVAMGESAVAPLAAAMPALHEGAARRALRVLASLRTPAAADAIVVALAREDVGDEARLELHRMGPAALDALARLAATDARGAELIATANAPLDARMHAMVAALAAPATVWHDEHGPARALVSEATRGNALDQWLALVPDTAVPAARALTVAAEAAQGDAQRAAVAARARTVRATTFEDRFRLLLPLAGDADGRAQVSQVALHDPDDDLRAEAVRALGAAGNAFDTLRAALADRVPRVRAEAARALAGVSTARDALLDRLEHDGWPSVRAASALSLGGAPENVPALAHAAESPSHVVAAASITALARTNEPTIARRLMDYAESSERNPEMRVEALAALSRRCERSIVDRLMPLFLRQNDPVLPPPEQAIGHAALAALAHIDPARARAEITRLQINPAGLAAIQRAMQNPCPAR